MKVLSLANPDGSFCDLDELLDRISYKTTKQSMQFSIRSLIKGGLIEKKGTETRRGRSRVVLGFTEHGYTVFNRDPSVVVEGISGDELEEIEEIKGKFNMVPGTIDPVEELFLDIEELDL